METFAEIIKREREKRNWILRRAAARLDIDQALISKFEKGERRPSREQVEKFARVYKLKREELINIWMSDKIAYEISSESNPEKILKIAEKKIEYLNSKNK